MREGNGTTTTWMILLSVIGSLWNSGSIATGSRDTETCQFNQCSDHDRKIEFSVACSEVSITMKWTASEDSLFGFCVQYQCSTDPNLSHCTDTVRQVGDCEKIHNKEQTHTYLYDDVGLPDNATCWFWVKDVAYGHCSADSYCNITTEPPVTTTSSAAVMYNLETITDSPTIISSIYPTSSDMSNKTFISILESPSSTVQSIPFTTDSISTLVSTKPTQVTNNTTNVVLATTVNNTTAHQKATSTMHQPTLTLHPQGTSSPQNTPHPSLIVVVVLFVTFLMVLLATTGVFIYWRKQNHSKLEIKPISKIEEVINIPSIDIQHVESDSDVESLSICEDEIVSRLSENPDDIYKQIVDGRPLTPQMRISSISLFSKEDACGDCTADYDVTSDYYSSTNGSGGQCCSQSSTTNYFNNTGAPSVTDDNSGTSQDNNE